MKKVIPEPNKEVRNVVRAVSAFFILHFSFLALPFLALGQQPAPLPDEDDLPEPDDSWEFTSRPGISASLRAMLDKLVPEGRSHEGLRYPIYSDGKADGAPVQEAEFQTARMSRLDETWLRFEQAQFQFFEDEANPDTATRTIFMEEATYDIRYDLLFTGAPVKIDDQAGSIHSGAMLYDHTTGLTIFSGGVELYPYEVPEAAVPAAPAPESAPLPERPATKPGTP